MALPIIKDIDKLRPEIQPLAKEFLRRTVFGAWRALMVETLRTQARQTELYKAGKTPVAKIGPHGSGLAFDIAFFQKIGNVERAKVSYDYALYYKAGPIGEKLGFTWGGRWPSRDLVHFQWDKPLGSYKVPPRPQKPLPKPKTSIQKDKIGVSKGPTKTKDFLPRLRLVVGRIGDIKSTTIQVWTRWRTLSGIQEAVSYIISIGMLKDLRTGKPWPKGTVVKLKSILKL